MYSKQPYQPPITQRNNVEPSTVSGRPVSDISIQTPTGFYVLAVASFVGLVASFFDTAQHHLMISAMLFVALLLALALLARAAIARMLLTAGMCLLVLMSVVSAVVLVGYQRRMNQATTSYQRAMGHAADPGHLTSAQKSQMNTYQSQMAELRKKAGRNLGYSYLLLAAYSAGGIVTVLYLNQPAARAAVGQSARRQRHAD